MLHEKLKDLVTCFSPVLRDVKHMEDVTVGGEITRVFNTAELILNTADQAKLSDNIDDMETYYTNAKNSSRKHKKNDAGEEEKEFYVYMSLDDGLGELSTVLVDQVYDKCKDKIFLGNVVLVKGIVHKLSAEKKPNGGRAAFRPPPWDIRIYAISVSTLPQADQTETCEE